MDRADPPEAFGVFKPVGHVVISFPSMQQMEAAARALADEGIVESAQVRFTPGQMVARADIDIAKASPLASLGQELNLVKAHRELAARGYAFLIVEADGDAGAARIAKTAARFQATRAQHYGRFMIEDLIEPGDGETQVGESPDRGLDPQTRSGEEGSRPKAH